MSLPPEKRSRVYFDSGFYCAESVLLAIAEEAGIESDLLRKIATGFCGGVSHTDGVCGAVSGGILAINLLTGRSSPDESVARNYRLVNRFVQGFRETFATLQCSELIGCDLSDPSGQARFRRENRIEQCKDIVETTTRLVREILKGTD